MRLRSVELELPRRDAAVDFLRDIWGLVEVARRGPTAFLRGAGDHPYLVALTEASTASTQGGEGCARSAATIRARSAAPRAASITLEGFAAHGAEAVSTSPEAFREFLPRDRANTAKVVKAAGLQAE